MKDQKTKKYTWVFSCIKNSKFGSVFNEQKPLISEDWLYKCTYDQAYTKVSEEKALIQQVLYIKDR